MVVVDITVFVAGGSSVPVAGRAPWLVVEEYQHHPTSLDDKWATISHCFIHLPTQLYVTLLCVCRTSKRRKADDSRPSLNFNTGT